MTTETDIHGDSHSELDSLAGASARFAADLYFFIARRVIEDLGEAGEQAVRRGLQEFGMARGGAIRAAAEKAGDPIDLGSFFRHYDLPMGRAWRSEVSSAPNKREAVVNYCPFAARWQEQHGESEGQIYCEEVDPAIRAGYSYGLRFNASRFILRGDGFCAQADDMLGEP